MTTVNIFMRVYYESENANVHRGVHALSQIATDRYEAARKKAARFLGAPVACEIVFTRGTTEAINLVAQTFGVGSADLDAFIAAVQGRPDRSSVRLRTIGWNGSTEVITMKLDRHYWPGYELRHLPEGWQRRIRD